MTAIRTTPTHEREIAQVQADAPPRWLSDLLRGAPARPVACDDGDLTLRQQSAGDFTLVTAELRGAAEMDAPAFERGAQRAYTAVLEAVQAGRHTHPVRVWNVVPNLLSAQADGRNRYMVFNAGRFAAYQSQWGGDPRQSAAVPTASAVDGGGGSLHVACLAANRAGIAIENPRQRPAYRYSSRFGPLPPCFARMTMLMGSPAEPPAATLLIGGTASVRGETSQHPGNVPDQLRETLDNLGSLIGAARERFAAETGATCSPSPPLHACVELRVFTAGSDVWRIARPTIERSFPGVGRIEHVDTHLCRDDLLIEIEGVAQLRASEPHPSSNTASTA